jgi:hypothetical protein
MDQKRKKEVIHRPKGERGGKRKNGPGGRSFSACRPIAWNRERSWLEGLEGRGNAVKCLPLLGREE